MKVPANMDALWQRLLRSLHYRLRRWIRPDPQRDVGDTFADGHYHSPLPAQAVALRYLSERPAVTGCLPGIDLNSSGQIALLQAFQRYYPELPFPQKKTDGCRYWYDQPWLGHADAIYLYSILRHFRPHQVIEVGSGYSSALIIETVERFLQPPPQFSMIEPEPQRLNDALEPADLDHYGLLQSEVQNVPLQHFTKLTANDLLFIDSSHVLKCGSDLQFLLFEVLPSLAEGVIVHFHDVFYPFEYPAEWIRAGRYWNECYLLHAFLFNNREWEILLFGDYLAQFHRTELKSFLPLVLQNTGGSLYLRRRNSADPYQK
jgi:hypothetical protein